MLEAGEGDAYLFEVVIFEFELAGHLTFCVGALPVIVDRDSSDHLGYPKNTVLEYGLEFLGF